MIRTTLVLFLLMFAAVPAHAQDGLEPVGDTGDSLQVKADTAEEADFVPTKSPWGAVLRSAVLPGLGQFYNESYWKVPIVLGVTAFMIRGYIIEHDNFAVYRDIYEREIVKEEPDVSLVRTKQLREFYRDRRDTYAWWLGVFYLLQLADAFVDAHMYDFDVSDEVNISLGPQPNGMLGLSLRW